MLPNRLSETFSMSFLMGFSIIIKTKKWKAKPVKSSNSNFSCLKKKHFTQIGVNSKKLDLLTKANAGYLKRKKEISRNACQIYLKTSHTSHLDTLR